MGLIRFNSRRVIHMSLDQTTALDDDDTIFTPYGFRIVMTTTLNTKPMKSYLCVLTCSFHDIDDNMELLTLDIDQTSIGIQRKVSFITPTDIQVPARLFLPSGGNPRDIQMLLPVVHRDYLKQNFRFNLYIMETFPDDKLSRDELYNGTYLDEIISV